MTSRIPLANLRSARRSRAKSGAHLAFFGALTLVSLAPSGALGTSPTPAAPGTAQPRKAAYAAMIDGDHAVVGAQWQRGYQGGAFVLERGSRGWARPQTLSPAGLGRHDHFGCAVAINGNTIVVGARWHDGLRGAAYVFQRRGDRWVEQQRLTIPDAAPDTRFGETVAFEGDLIRVGSRSGVVRTFQRSGVRWTERAAAGAQASRAAAPRAPPASVAATDDIRAVTALVEGAAGAPPVMPLTAVTDTLDWVVATDGAFEDRVEITWRNPAPRGDILYRITRQSEVLSYLSSDDSLFNDRTATRGLPYSYCVSIADMDDSVGPAKCDDGHRAVFAPSVFSASDGQSVHHVQLTWQDRSRVEVGYVVRRAGERIDSLAANSRSYADTTAVAGTPYTYDVVAVDSTGSRSQPVSDEGFRGFFPPALSVSASDGEYPDRVVITWSDTTTNELGYDVFRNGNLIATLLSSGVDTTYTDSTTVVDTNYEYCVEAFGPFGLRSISVCDSGGTFLPAPLNVSASDATLDDRVQVTWDDPSGLAAQYIISRNTTPQDTVPGFARSYDDRTAVAGVSYGYCVKAITGSGGVSASACNSGIRSVVLAPTDVAATDGAYENRVEITWKSTSVMAVLFKVFRDSVFIKSVGANSRSYVDAAGTAGRGYAYRVRAATSLNVNSAAVSDSGYRQLRTPAAVSASDAAAEDRVQVSWTDNSQVEHGYAIYRRTPAGDSTQIGRTAANIGALTDRTGAPGTRYTYAVAAYDSVSGVIGESAHASNEGRRELLAPSAVMASDGEFEKKIEISWQDHSNAEDGYYVYRDTVRIGTLPDNANAFTDDNAPFRAKTIYRVTAFDAYGESAAMSDTGSTTIRAPESLNASDAYADSIRLKWVDDSEIEDGYRVYREGALIATLEANRTYFTDNAAPTVNVAYDYALEAYKDTSASIRVNDSGMRLVPAEVTPTTSIGSSLKLISGGVPWSNFGVAVGINGDNALVGAHEVDVKGAAYAFARRTDGTWAQAGRLEAKHRVINADFGLSVGISGDLAVVGGPGHPVTTGADGTVWIFSRQGNGTWVQSDTLTGTPCNLAHGRFGHSTAISGDYVIVGAPQWTSGCTGPADNEGRAYIFERNPTDGSWTRVAITSPLGVGAQFGWSVAISGDRAAVAGIGAARVATYRRDGGAWTQESILYEGGGAGFGNSVAISGDLMVVGAYSDGTNGPVAGAAYIYRRTPGNTWEQELKLLPSDGQSGAQFGWSVAIDGGLVVVGAQTDDDKGAAYIFGRNADSTWTEVRKVVQADGALGDNFGSGVAIHESRALVGATGDDDQALNSGSSSVIYVVEPPNSVTASDGAIENRVEIRWQDASEDETGFFIYRDGERIASTGRDIDFYTDYSAEAGRTYAYEVSAVNELGSYESARTSDFGWRPANGSITGRITAGAGGGVAGASVRLEPPPGRSLLFDGAGGHVSIPDDSTFDFRKDSAFTIETWFRYSGHDRSPRLISKMPATATGRRPFDVGFQTVTGRLYFLMSDGTNTARVMTARDSLNDDRWHHVACVSDSARLFVYVDGLFEGSVTKPALLGDVTNNSDVVLGGVAADSWLGGQLDEIRIWKVARDSAQIDSTWNQPLTGKEADLLGYWRADGGAGPVITDSAPRQAHYGHFEGGVYWSDEVAPINVSVRTDSEGAFVLNGIRYGETANFRVRPSLGTHTFEPASNPVTLSTASPIWNGVTFTDVTSYTIAGRVRFKDTNCFVPSVQIIVDGGGPGTGLTDKNGKFALAVSEGRHSIRAYLEGRTLEASLYASATAAADSLKFDHIDADQFGVEFLDLTTHALRGKAGGMGDRAVGRVTVTIRSEDNCLARNAVVTGAGAGYAFALPPQKYLVSATVDSIEPALIARGLRPDILQFFQTLGEREIDLTTVADTTLDFVYQPPLAVTIDGFDSSESCPQLSLADGTRLPANLPILPQFKRIPLTISVEAVYGENDRVPVDSAVVVIRDEIRDKEDNPDTLYVRRGGGGNVAYLTAGTSPSLLRGRMEGPTNRSFQKAITATALVEGRAPVSRTEWVLVTGSVAPPGTKFVTATTTEVPLFILRDPPGDGSSSYVEEGFNQCQTIKFNNAIFSAGAGPHLRLTWGWDKTILTAVGGPGAVIGTITTTQSMAEFETGLTLSYRSTKLDEVEACISARKRYATAGGADIPRADRNKEPLGEAGDVFIGAGFNLLFADADSIGVTGCTVTQGIVPAVQPGDSIPTTFVYTRTHIENVLIPELKRKAEQYPSVIHYTTFKAQAENWARMLAFDDSLKKAAENGRNISFSGGTSFGYSQQADTTKSYLMESAVIIDFETSGGNETLFEEFALASFELGLHTSIHSTFTIAKTDTAFTEVEGFGYTLSDDDVGDNFTVDVLSDSTFLSPVFRVRGGESSCPYEPWPDSTGAPAMVARDRPVLFLDPAEGRLGAPQDRPASLKLTVGNNSDQEREYSVRLLSSSNGGGALVKINGSPAEQGAAFTIRAREAREAFLTVERGPTRLNYPDLELVVGPSCGDDQTSDSLKFSVSFEGCSDIRLSGPDVEPGWILEYTPEGASPGDTLELVFDRYELDVDTPTGTIKLQKIGAEYRYMGIDGQEPGAWQPVRNVGGHIEIDYGVHDHIFDASPDTTIRWVPDESLPDGVYELRAFTKCSQTAARGYSEPSRGRIDRHRPLVFGTPEPADGQLSLGEDIRITFNEPIRCGLADTSVVSLTYLDGPDAGDRIPIRVTCTGNEIAIVPVVASSEYEGRNMRATIAPAQILHPLPNHGVFDLVGNPMEGSVSWDFEWRKSLFAWSRSRISQTVPLGVGASIPVELANGRSRAVDYSFPVLPAHLAVATGDEAGRIQPGDTRLIHFNVAPGIPGGVNSLQVVARADSAGIQVGAAVLNLYLDVACVAPQWDLAASDFEYSMSIVGKVLVGATPIEETTLRLAAFVGDELRGVASPQPLGSDPVYLTVFSNRTGGETVRFEVWDDDDCKRYPATEERVAFRADSILGSPADPMQFHALVTAPSQGRFSLTQGWNWFSTHVANGAPGGMAVTNVLAALTPSAGDLIKSKTAFAVFDPDTSVGWVGSLAVLDNVQSYMIRLSGPGDILQEGTAVDPALVDISVVNGWNWIAYSRNAPQAFRSALANLTPLLGEGDVLRGQAGFARYKATGLPEWLGDDLIMEPGKGYRLLIHGSGGTFTFAANGPVTRPAIAAASAAAPGGRQAAKDPPLSTLAGWQCEASRYAGNMTVIAAVRSDGVERRSGDDLIGAFVGDECRGVGRVMYVKGLDRYLAFLTIHGDGNDPETVAFRMLDPATGSVADIAETMPFEADAELGSLREPLVLGAGPTRDQVPRAFRLAQNQPNPFRQQSTLSFELPSATHVELTIYDVRGQKVRDLVNRNYTPGSYSAIWDGTTSARTAAPSGVYFYKLKAGSFTDTKKLVLIR